eukprot:CAMPEP_0168589764 /NCGR_PEP_ID=MMETSP0420-20121227/6191_1 /TAXON_ID=498008 /ORGANISM="Pessonella sp." /LENGTH=211 /DNA_ID=CAMNT_0008625343 /DNA_START=671 /DNA_END=1302 /DNA_ORIENTATION=+
MFKKIRNFSHTVVRFTRSRRTISSVQLSRRVQISLGRLVARVALFLRLSVGTRLLRHTLVVVSLHWLGVDASTGDFAVRFESDLQTNLEVPDAYPKRAPIYIQVFKLFFEEQGWELEENSPALNAAYFQDLNFSSENFHSRLLRFKNPPFFNCPKPFRSSYPGTGLWNKSLGVEAWKCGPMNNGVQVDLRMALMHTFPATREVLQDERLKA